MSDTTYSGWTNWETWNTALWIDNDEGSHRERLRMWANGGDGEYARRVAETLFPDKTPDMDKTDGGYDAVNWQEIADAWNEE